MNSSFRAGGLDPRPFTLCLLVALAGCGGDDAPPAPDLGTPDDAGMHEDAGTPDDSGMTGDAGDSDAGDSDAGASDAGDACATAVDGAVCATTFACDTGGLRCDRDTEFCSIARADVPGEPDVIRCEPRPASCATLTCACFPTGVAMTCTDDADGGVTVTYLGG